LTLLDRLREDPDLCHTPVVVVSRADRRTAITAFDYPMVVGYQPKPVDRKWLLQNLRKLEKGGKPAVH
jgi:CheY-like chemotaxis protein